MARNWKSCIVAFTAVYIKEDPAYGRALNFSRCADSKSNVYIFLFPHHHGCLCDGLYGLCDWYHCCCCHCHCCHHYPHSHHHPHIGLIRVKEEGRTGFSKSWQGCSEGFPEGEGWGKSLGAALPAQGNPHPFWLVYSDLNSISNTVFQSAEVNRRVNFFWTVLKDDSIGAHYIDQGLFCHDQMSSGKLLAFFHLWHNLQMFLYTVKPKTGNKNSSYKTCFDNVGSFLKA